MNKKRYTNKRVWQKKHAQKMVLLKISLERSFKTKLKSYFATCKNMIKEGRGNNLPSIKSILQGHSDYCIKTLLSNKSKKSVDKIKLWSKLEHANDHRINSQSSKINDYTHELVHRSLTAAIEELKKDGNTPPEAITNKVAARIFSNYSIARIENIAVSETQGYVEKSRYAITKEIQTQMKFAIDDDNLDDVDELDDMADSWAITEIADNYREDNSDKHDLAIALSSIMKIWETMGDSKVREWHQEADGQEQPLDQPFDVMGESLDFPGDDSYGASPENICNCRCVSVT